MIEQQQKEEQSEQQQLQQPKEQQQHIPTVIDIPSDFEDTVVKKYDADRYECCPPPLFIVLMSLIEIGVFVYDLLTTKTQMVPAGPIPVDSVFIYRPDRRQEIWRFISYMVLHANWFHLGFNVVVQVMIGLPLEMVHGSLRIACIYLAGVFAGSLGTSVVDAEVYLVGASGGVYALLAAHLANILLNFGEMKYGVLKLASILIFASCDFGYAIYSRHVAEPINAPSVSYVAHITGALAGLTIGLLVLKNFDHRPQKFLLWWSALGIYAAFTIFAIVFNLVNTMTAQILEEEGEVIKQHLLHDLGVS
ncbi:unnamed protein product [Hermetia illucens]|uniref:rhomboid protease n=1 Tax=Hermetia illucens TaxID=343691 RepID=A0A7R8YR29_HERIL|nr:protein rhomboid-like [Hermetia illucens]CAD7082036.1 unnamed protein product [Hermetia illucens]